MKNSGLLESSQGVLRGALGRGTSGVGIGLALLLFFALWDMVMDMTDEMGTDPERERLYRAASGLPSPDPTSYPPQERFVHNSLGMQLALIPPGEFIMGSPLAEYGRVSGEMPHRVRITKPFYLGVHEVTVGQFRRFVAATGYRACRESRDVANPAPYYYLALRLPPNVTTYSWENPGFDQRDNHPVVQLRWADAVEFCRWLSRTEGCQPMFDTSWASRWLKSSVSPYFSTNPPALGSKSVVLIRLGFLGEYVRFGRLFLLTARGLS